MKEDSRNPMYKPVFVVVIFIICISPCKNNENWVCFPVVSTFMLSNRHFWEKLEEALSTGIKSNRETSIVCHGKHV